MIARCRGCGTVVITEYDNVWYDIWPYCPVCKRKERVVSIWETM